MIDNHAHSFLPLPFIKTQATVSYISSHMKTQFFLFSGLESKKATKFSSAAIFQSTANDLADFFSPTYHNSLPCRLRKQPSLFRETNLHSTPLQPLLRSSPQTNNPSSPHSCASDTLSIAPSVVGKKSWTHSHRPAGESRGNSRGTKQRHCRVRIANDCLRVWYVHQRTSSKEIEKENKKKKANI